MTRRQKSFSSFHFLSAGHMEAQKSFEEALMPEGLVNEEVAEAGWFAKMQPFFAEERELTIVSEVVAKANQKAADEELLPQLDEAAWSALAMCGVI